MLVLIVLFWFIAYTTGIICIALAAINYRKHPDRELKALLFLLAVITCSIIPFTLKSVIEKSRLLWTISSVSFEILIITLTLISQWGLCLLLSAFPRYTHAALNLEHGILDRILFVLAVVLCAAFGVDILLFSTIGGRPFGILAVWVTVSIFILFPLAMVYTLLIRLLNRKKVFKTENRSCILTLSGSVLALAMLLREFLPGYASHSIPSILAEYILPGMYLFLSVSLLVPLAKNLTAAPQMILNRDLLARYHISPREEDVITHLIKGVSYKEIGGLLHISLPTVQSHISRIYQKAGVRSKVELIHLLTGN